MYAYLASHTPRTPEYGSALYLLFDDGRYQNPYDKPQPTYSRSPTCPAASVPYPLHLASIPGRFSLFGTATRYNSLRTRFLHTSYTTNVRITPCLEMVRGPTSYCGKTQHDSTSGVALERRACPPSLSCIVCALQVSSVGG